MSDVDNLLGLRQHPGDRVDRPAAVRSYAFPVETLSPIDQAKLEPYIAQLLIEVRREMDVLKAEVTPVNDRL